MKMDIIYWKNVLNKIIENLISVKVWIITSVLCVSTFLILHGFMTGGEWVAINTTLITIIGAMREVFKVASIKKIINDTEMKDLMKVLKP